MIPDNGLEWNLIVTYYDEVINTGSANFVKSFELYRSRSYQLAWSSYKPTEHINPQEKVYLKSVTKLDIGKMLAEMVHFELKTPGIKPSIMVENNQDLVGRILDYIKSV